MEASTSRARKALLAIGLMTICGLAGVAAQDIAPGTLAAAIRSSGHPCNHVVESTNEGPSVWKVKCNAGSYRVSKSKDATLDVTPLD